MAKKAVKTEEAVSDITATEIQLAANEAILAQQAAEDNIYPQTVDGEFIGGCDCGCEQPCENCTCGEKGVEDNLLERFEKAINNVYVAMGQEVATHLPELDVPTFLNAVMCRMVDGEFKYNIGQRVEVKHKIFNDYTKCEEEKWLNATIVGRGLTEERYTNIDTGVVTATGDYKASYSVLINGKPKFATVKRYAEDIRAAEHDA